MSWLDDLRERLGGPLEAVLRPVVKEQVTVEKAKELWRDLGDSIIDEEKIVKFQDWILKQVDKLDGKKS